MLTFPDWKAPVPNLKSSDKEEDEELLGLATGLLEHAKVNVIQYLNFHGRVHMKENLTNRSLGVVASNVDRS